MAQASPEQARADACPLTIFIDAHGRLADSRFYGHYRVTRTTLLNDLGGGCKEAGPTSSVRIQASPRATAGRVKEIMDLVHTAYPSIPMSLADPAARTSR